VVGEKCQFTLGPRSIIIKSIIMMCARDNRRTVYIILDYDVQYGDKYFSPSGGF